MATRRAQKQWSLTKVEDVNSLRVGNDAKLAHFLVSGFIWNKISKTDPNLRLISDPSATFNERTAEKNVIQLNFILGQIANYCPVINETLSSESLLK